MASRRKPPPECRTCHAPLAFARVGQTTIAVDKQPVGQGGTVAAYRPATGGILVGRWLVKADTPASHEHRYQTHRCPRAPRPDPQPTLFDDR